MPSLIAVNNQIYELNTGKTIVGRDVLQCQIVLDQPFISRLQAVIEVRADGQSVIQNMSSRQSTFVNGAPIDACFLNDGDRVEFGIGQTIVFAFRGANQARAFDPHVSASSIPVEALSGDRTVAWHQPPTATSVFRVELTSRLRIGRAPDNEIVLDAPGVSRHHAELTYQGGEQPIISDLGSTNGTFVNGDVLRSPRLLQPSDWVTIGGFLLAVNGRDVRKQDLSASRLAAYQVSKSYGDKTVLQDVSIALYPREFVGLMGASGCGKSTLMDALNGMRPASSGAVYVNDLDLYTNFDLLRRSIGYVPQRDILHEALTVERTLFFAAKMRLPSGTIGAQIDEVVGEVIQTVGLEDQRHNQFRQLSGGQQKRLSLGIELITKPNFLFLDEPTSPLDPETTENMMLLFRKLADEGRIVVMVTHKFEKFNSMHHVALLTKGGRLAFFGPPQESLRYFNCQEPTEIYRRLGERTPEEASTAFQRSPQFQRYVASRFSEMQEMMSGGLSLGGQIRQTGAERNFGFGQWWTLTQRCLEIKLKDFRNTILLLAQAPIVALILSVITDDTPNDGRTIFIAAVIAMWLGANNAIREIVSESGVYGRERLVNLKIPSYVMSKFTILSGIGLIQCFLFVVILTQFERFSSVDLPMLTLILYLTLLAGAAIGLFFSALVSSTEKAMSILPLILIPQLLLSGFLKPLDDLYVNLRTSKPATVAEYDKFKREEKDPPKVNPNNPTEIPKIADPVQKSEGLGGVKPFAALMTARWTIDALAHQVSINDLKARDDLAARMTVEEYQNVLDKRSDSAISDAYGSRVQKDLFVLALFSILFLILTMAALKRKDAL
ncbi:MAG: FHA domain-containing protein [Acidobacteria bacterium]|nr:FHA domain-containing protein [Acidobacteriota bacterium]